MNSGRLAFSGPMLAYALAPGVGACLADGRLVFLDLRGDRYLMVEPRLEQLLTSRRPCEPAEDEARKLERLCRLGLLVRAAERRPLPLCAAPEPACSLLEQCWSRPTIAASIAAAGSLLWATSTLRRHGLAEAVEALRPTGSSVAGDTARTLRCASAFAELRLLVRSLNRCLPLSLALVRQARPADPEVRLVLGVKLNPFGAHAWAQRGELVLNDRLDAVRAFTPVLVV